MVSGRIVTTGRMLRIKRRSGESQPGGGNVTEFTAHGRLQDEAGHSGLSQGHLQDGE